MRSPPHCEQVLRRLQLAMCLFGRWTWQNFVSVLLVKVDLKMVDLKMVDLTQLVNLAGFVLCLGKSWKRWKKKQINLLVSKCKSPALRWVLLPVLQMHHRAHNSCVEFKLRSEETIDMESLLSRANVPCKPKIQPAASFDPGDSSAGGVDLAILLAASQGANT